MRAMGQPSETRRPFSRSDNFAHVRAMRRVFFGLLKHRSTKLQSCQGLRPTSACIVRDLRIGMIDATLRFSSVLRTLSAPQP